MEKLKINRIIEVGFWITLFSIMTFYDLQFFSVQQALTASFLRTMTFAGVAYLNIYFLIPRFFNRKGFIWYALSILALILTIRLVTFQVAPIGPKGIIIEIKRLSDDGKETIIQRNANDLAFAFGLMTIFSTLFISSSYKLGVDFIQKERNEFQLEKEKMASEMKFLRTQINPHFFFNALNNLYAISRTKPKRTGEFIGKLSDMLRYVIYDCNQSSVPLKKEIEYLENYVYFQEIKEDENLKIRFETDIENPDFGIEPMIFLPLLENAFKHGYSMQGDDTLIEIKVKQAAKQLLFVCKNTLPSDATSSTPDPSYSGIGIKNIRARLAYSYPDKHQLKITNDGVSFLVELTLEDEAKA